MDQAVQFINEVGFPIAAALGLGFFIWKLINRIIDGMETKVDVLDDKVADQRSFPPVRFVPSWRPRIPRRCRGTFSPYRRFPR
mgnify:CR=1 FL=1